MKGQKKKAELTPQQHLAAYIHDLQVQASVDLALRIHGKYFHELTQKQADRIIALARQVSISQQKVA